MTHELTALFDYFEKEKGMSRDKVIEAVSRALLSAAKKRLGPLREMRVDIEPDRGEMKVFTKPLVVESVTNKWEQSASRGGAATEGGCAAGRRDRT